MAQAARLNLRLQKELKQLLSDPPPGASFPNLSTSGFASLSTFHPQIEGPEGTVYANGFFQIKIQIPERYPFQPPIVTFETPIYHPNIDTGGRICLDILNLPPKGAWQPSLNLFTVLTTIRLLLSEPNPDDGLMCEASREYKYNRQAFDQKARSMTEKYAKADEGRNSSSQYLIHHSNSDVADTGIPLPGKVSKDEANDEKIVHSKTYGFSKKMSLGSSGPSQKMDDDRRVYEVLNLSSAKQTSNQGPPQGSKESSTAHFHSDAVHRTRHKLSLASLDQSRKSADALKVKTSQDIHPLVLDSDPMACEALSLPSQPDIQSQLQHREDVELSPGKISLRPKKLCLALASQKQSLGSVTICQVVDESCTMKDASPKVSALHTNNPMPEPQVGKDGLKPPAEPSGQLDKGSDGVNHEKLSAPAAKKLSSGFRRSGLKASDNKENLMLNQSYPDKFLARLSSQSPDSVNRQTVSNSQKENALRSRKLSLQPRKQLKASNARSSPPVESVTNINHDSKRKREHSEDQEGKLCFETIQIDQKATEEPSMTMTEEVIVLDSEDSGEEERNEPMRPKPSLARRRLALKCRG